MTFGNPAAITDVELVRRLRDKTKAPPTVCTDRYALGSSRLEIVNKRRAKPSVKPVSSQQKPPAQRAGKRFLSKRQLFLGSIRNHFLQESRRWIPQDRSKRGVGYRVFQEYRQKRYTRAAAKITENLGVSDRLLQIPPSTIYNKGILSPICMLPRDLTMTHPVWSVSVSQLTSSPN